MVTFRPVLATLALVALAVAGCAQDKPAPAPKAEPASIEDRSLGHIEKAMRRDMSGLRSVTVSGKVTSKADGTYKVTTYAGSNGNCKVDVAQRGGRATMLLGAEGGFLRGDATYLREVLGESDASLVAQLEGQWMRTTAKVADPTEFSEFCDLDVVLNQMGTMTEAAKGKVTRVGDREAIEVFGREDGGTTRMWVATQAPHHLLRVTADGPEPSDFVFGGFGDKVDFTPPAEYFDAAE